ncbi:hypothetical protein, partial [Escherichia coli]|uniref:hypothetical protein n=1 Tax=Escherichia coli TaxID=562 RepID=UPI001CDADD71
EKRVFLVILFTSFSGSLVSRIPGAVHYGQKESYSPQEKSTSHDAALTCLKTHLKVLSAPNFLR